MTEALRRDADAQPDCATATWFAEADLERRIADAGFDD
jgi:hypothetical protein